MKSLPTVNDPDEFGALIIRTDYQNEEAWQRVLVQVDQPWGDRNFDPVFTLVNDPTWADVTVDRIRELAKSNEDLEAVFVADHVTMESPDHPLLVVNASDLVDEEYEDSGALTESVAVFRAMPAEIHHVHANLATSNLDFEEFVNWAQQFPDGILRPE
ncbi:DUF6924 domain-containing protein [Streptomyces sp. NPDC059989]|uniref:DUF6924 domain-containing protein n=1 Tax=Streptomyces sp. NPDC059989 TaxID=3347026 RepID=UPI0036994518